MYQRFDSDGMDDSFDDLAYDGFSDEFDLLEDEDFDAASRNVRQQRARVEQQRRRQLAKQQRRSQRRAQQQRRRQSQTPSASAPARPLTVTEQIQVGLGRALSDNRVGPIARTVGPVVEAVGQAVNSSTIETIGQLVGTAGDILPADEFDALEEMVNAAERQGSIRALAPEITRLTLRNVMPGTADLPSATRRQIAQSITSATQTLTQRHGIQSARAIPHIINRVQSNAQHHRLPLQALPLAIRRTTARVANSPTLVQQLTQVSTRGRTLM